MSQDSETVTRKLFVWGNNDKWQLGMDSGNANPDEALNTNGEDSNKEIPVPHLLDPDPFIIEDEVIERK